MADLDRATFLWPILPTGPRGAVPVVILSTRKPFNGSVRTLRRNKLTDAQLRAAITVNGGEVLSFGER